MAMEEYGRASVVAVNQLGVAVLPRARRRTTPSSGLVAYYGDVILWIDEPNSYLRDALAPTVASVRGG